MYFFVESSELSSGVKTGKAFLLLIVKDYNNGFLFFVSFCLHNYSWPGKKVRSDCAYVQICGLRSGCLHLVFAMNNRWEVVV